MSFTLIQQATPRLHRSELAVPGSNPSLFEKAAKGQADIIFLDLEDAVAPDDKEQARKNIIQGLNDLDWGTKTMMIRINGLDTHYAYRDVVDVVENCPRLDMILIPKTGVPQDVYAIDMLVTQIEQYKKREKKIGFEVLIETALGMANVEAIAQASKRLEAMSFGVADYAASTRARTVGIGGPHPDYGVLTDKDADGKRAYYWNDPWHYALSRMMVACRAYGLAPDRRAVRRFLRPRRLPRGGEARRRARLRGQMGDPSFAGRARQQGVHAVGSRGDQGQAHRRGDEAGGEGGQGRGVARRPPDRPRLDPPGRGPAQQGQSRRDVIS